VNAIQYAKMCGFRGSGVWKLIASVLLAAVLLTPLHAQGEGGFQCPPEDIIRTKCLGPKDCLYPHPNDCGSFIQCTVNPGGVTGTPVVMPCPAGLQWNDDEKICDQTGDCS
jgi:Chitin binding Peritrophin-A domain